MIAIFKPVNCVLNGTVTPANLYIFIAYKTFLSAAISWSTILYKIFIKKNIAKKHGSKVKKE